MTKQEAFDRVYDHFITQNNPSTNDPTKNKYHHRRPKMKLNSDPDSPRSSIGIFIEHYEQRFEKMPISKLLKEGVLPAFEDDESSSVVWQELKLCHDIFADASPFKESMEFGLVLFAADHWLKIRKPSPEVQAILDKM